MDKMCINTPVDFLSCCEIHQKFIFDIDTFAEAEYTRTIESKGAGCNRIRRLSFFGTPAAEQGPRRKPPCCAAPVRGRADTPAAYIADGSRPAMWQAVCRTAIFVFGVGRFERGTEHVQLRQRRMDFGRVLSRVLHAGGFRAL
jgi:hypothetical protein